MLNFVGDVWYAVVYCWSRVAEECILEMQSETQAEIEATQSMYSALNENIALTTHFPLKFKF